MRRTTPRVLVIEADGTSEQITSPNQRLRHFAGAIAARQPVTLAVSHIATRDVPDGVTLVTYDDETGVSGQQRSLLAELVRDHDVIVAQRTDFVEERQIYEALSSRYVVVDLCMPWLLQQRGASRDAAIPSGYLDVATVKRQLSIGDFYLCESERQRDFWIGALAMEHRLELPYAVASPGLRSLIDVVSFVLPESLPRKTGPGPRSIFEQIGDNDPVIIVLRGPEGWTDVQTTIRAVAQVAHETPTFRLIFIDLWQPDGPSAWSASDSIDRSVAGDLGLLDRHVFFAGYVDAAQRTNWLFDSDAVISAQVDAVEGRYTIPPVMLEAFRCGVPALVSDGTALADLVRHEGIGQVASAGNVDALANAIRRVLDRDRARALRANLTMFADRHSCENVCVPLLAYCRSPWRLRLRGSVVAGDDESVEQRFEREIATYLKSRDFVRQNADKGMAAPLQPEEVLTRPDLGALFRRKSSG